MKHNMKSLLQLAAAALFFACAPALAATQTLGFTEANQAPPFITHKDVTPGGDAASTFSLDLHFETGTQPVFGIAPLIHYNSKKIEVIGVTNIMPPGLVNRMLDRYPHHPPTIKIIGGFGVSDKVARRHGTEQHNSLFGVVTADTDTALRLVWLDQKSIQSANAAVAGNPVRLATITFRWKAGIVGNSHIALSQFRYGTAQTFTTTSVVVRSHPVASIATSLHAIDVTANETSIRLECALSRPMPVAATCNLHRANSTAASPADYTISPDIPSADIVIPPGKTSGARIFTISPLASGKDKMLAISLAGAVAGGESLAIKPGAGVVNIEFTEPALVVSTSNISAEEGDDIFTFNVWLSLRPASGDVVVNLSSSDESEAAVGPASLRFTAADWDTPQRVAVLPVDDNYDDGDKKYDIMLSVDDGKTGETRYHGVRKIVRGTTVDNEKVEIVFTPTPYLRSLGDRFVDGQRDIDVTLRLTGGVYEFDAVATLSTAGGTAVNGTHYVESAQDFIFYGDVMNGATIRIPQGESSVTRRFNITLLEASYSDNRVAFIDLHAVVTRGKLRAHTTKTVRIRFVHPGVFVPRVHSIPNAGTIETIDTGTTDSFGVRLGAPPKNGYIVVRNSVITYPYPPRGATVAPASLTFTPDNWRALQSVTVTGVDDTQHDGDVEYTVQVYIDRDETTTSFHSYYRSWRREVRMDGVNRDSNPAPPPPPPMTTVSVTARFESLDAAAGEASLAVACALSNRIAAETTCTLAHANDAAAPGAGYSVTPPINDAAIIIPAGRASKARRFTVMPSASGGDATLTITLRSATSLPALVPELVPDNTPVEISLMTPSLFVSESSIVTDEKHSRAKFFVRLPAQPIGGKVVVRVRSDDKTEAKVTPASLTFNADNWSAPQSVTVRGVDDKIVDGDQPYTITLAVNAAKTRATRYYGITASVSGTNLDNDKVAVVLSAKPRSVSAEDRVRITATLEGGVVSPSDTVITLSKKGGSAVEGIDYARFTLPESITIRAGQPSDYESFRIPVLPGAADRAVTTFVIGGTISGSETAIADITLFIGAFDLDVDGERGVKADDIVLISRYLEGKRGAELVIGIHTHADPATIAARIKKGIRLLDVSGNGITDIDDTRLIYWYLILSGFSDPDPQAVVNLSRVAGVDAATVVRNIKRLLPNR
ncbi:MAG: hypothetical protein OD918_05670 [Gammaproteobacteria bacterium]